MIPPRFRCAVAFLSSFALSVAEPVVFIPATLDHIRMSNGAPMPDDLSAIGWKWHPNKLGSGSLVSADSPHVLMLSVDQLEADLTYEVFGYFIADAQTEDDTASPGHGAVQFGLTLASLHPFDGIRLADLVSKEPWVVTPNYETGKQFGYEAAVEADYPLPGLKQTFGSEVIRARLGISRAGEDGTLPVFFDRYSSFHSSGRASVLGVAVRPVLEVEKMDPIGKPGTRLHRAIRSGDSVTFQREIEAGADVNAVDEENLTPLFYAAASGDASLVKKLLELGAKPELNAQSVSPLVAAAADSEITRILLEAGAKVPLAPAMDKGRLAHEIDPWLLHPVIAAIRAGSVPVLKQLLAANPAITMQDIARGWERINISLARSMHNRSFVRSSMIRQNWDMAAYLIDSGFPIMKGEFASSANPDAVTLAHAVMAGKEAVPVFEALLRRGAPPVVGTSNDIYHRDALTTAAWLGDTDLVRRFLPFAKEVSTHYPGWLLEHALYSENEEVIDMVRNRFPDATVKRWEAPTENEDVLEEQSVRFFLPRTSPPPLEKGEKAAGKHVLAVIAAPEASAAGDTLTAFASSMDGWQVVERDKIEAALLEDNFSKPWLDGEHRLANLGDRLTADCLIVVSALRNGKQIIHRFEVVEVSTGLEIHREHFKDGAFVDQKEIAGLLTRATLAMDAACRNKRHQAITMLTFTAQGLKDPLAMSRILSAAVRHDVDATPGLISLSRAQSSRLMEERALVGKNSVWGAAHMIEGTVSSQGGSDIQVTLRLETYKDGKTTKIDVTASGDLSSIPETTSTAWQKLMTAMGQVITTPLEKPDAPDQALHEGRRLMREAEWLHSLGSRPVNYLPLIDSAIALGVPTRETIIVHLDGYYRHFWPPAIDHNGKPVTQIQNIGEVLSRMPASLQTSDRLVNLLPTARQFLDQTSWYLDREGTTAFDPHIDQWNTYGTYKSNEIWYAIQALSNIRTLIFRNQLTKEQREEFDAFTSDLDALTLRYFSLLKTVAEPDFLRYYIQYADFRLFERNPVLTESLVDMAATGGALAILMQVSPHTDPDTGAETRNVESLMRIRKRMAKMMVERIGEDSSIPLKLAKADLECFLAEQAQRPLAVRRLAELTAEARSHTVPTRQVSGSYLLSQIILNSSTTSLLFDSFNNVTALDHDGCLLPSSLFATKYTPDLQIRFNTYHKTFHILSQCAAWRQPDTNPDIDVFRQRIGGYFSWELSRLKTEAPSLKPINGVPSQSGKTSQDGPPGFFAPTKTTSELLKSNSLVSLFYGAGKKAVKSEKPIRPHENKPAQKSFTATLFADLRTDESPGNMVWPLVDNSNPDILWTFYFPSSGDGIHVNVAGGSGLQIRERDCKAPWLLGIDCRTGVITKKINLHTAVGEAYGLDLANRKCAIWEMAFDQTRSRILTNVGWHDENYASNKMGSVIIDKESGKAHPLPRNPEMLEGEGSVLFDIWDNRVGVVGIGEHFFYLDKAGDWTGGAIKGVRSDGLAIFEVSPDLTVKPLTVIGRKPELTPFDSADRSPFHITQHDNQLRVVHEATIAQFDPTSRAWSIISGNSSKKPTKADVTSIADARYWEFLQSIHKLRVNGRSTGWFAVGWNHRPGHLPLASREKGIHQFRISAVIPDDFLTTAYAIDVSDSGNPAKPNERRTLFKDHSRSKNYNMVVLAQTESDLIFGIQTSDSYEWNRPSRNAAHLPFLWKIPKKVLLDAVGENRNP